MKSTALLHEICESLPVENRKETMRAMKALRLQVKKEVISTMRNADKMITMLYNKDLF